MTDEGDLIAGRYRLVSRVGSGAMGVVWKAQDELLHRTVAVKQLLLPFGMSESEADEATRRAMREGRIAARLHHPHAIAVYDVVQHADKPCLIMEYLLSESLSAVLSTRGPLPPEDVAEIGSQIAAALAAAHQAGIVHRDIKPGNVLLTADGNAKITDFGISRAVGDATVTATGILAGTPAYLAPEVAQGQDAGFPADVFALGATLYAAVEGTPPFGFDDNPIALIYRITTSEVTPPTQAGPLTPVLERLLKRNPAQRPTMQEAQKVLAAVADHRPPPDSALPVPALRSSEAPPAKPATAVTAATAAVDVAAVDAVSGAAAVDATATATTDAAAASAPPPGPPTEGINRKSPRSMAAFVVAAGVLIALGIMAAVLINDGANTASSLPRVPDPTQSQQAPQPAPTPDDTSPAPNPAPIPQTSAAVPSTSVAATPSSDAGTPSDTPAELQAALSDYYALMPGNLDEGWTRMTASYQSNHASGFAGYQSFWNAVQRVEISDISATSPDDVSATLVYFYRDGRVIEERTSFGLVAEDDQWKIARSAVLSSQSR